MKISKKKYRKLRREARRRKSLLKKARKLEEKQSLEEKAAAKKAEMAWQWPLCMGMAGQPANGVAVVAWQLTSANRMALTISISWPMSVYGQLSCQWQL